MKVVWVHGFGGMGKSWFLHRVRLGAGPEVRSLVVDWNYGPGRAPLSSEPNSAADLDEVIAHRLARACGESAADPYWTARERVRVHSERRRKLLDQFDGQFSMAKEPERLDSAFLRVLRAGGVWADDPDERRRNLDALSQNPRRRDELFVAWCHDRERDAPIEAVEPDRVLAEALAEALRVSARSHPLLLLLDTCEVLSPEMDRSLRTLLAPLCDDETPLLVLIGSRLAPDVAVPAGRREGWQDLVRDGRFRPIPFDERVRLTVDQIEEALRKSSRPPGDDLAPLAEAIHRVSRGVPLAVRALLDDLEAVGSEGLLIGDLGEEGPHLEEQEAVRRVVGTVARRMLTHLEREDRPERQADLRDVIALALLQRADEDLLRALWRPRNVHQCLRDLANRYALVSGGDLHATVRDYLRRSWRDPAERPPLFDDVLSAAEQALAALPPPPDDPASPGAIARRVQGDNLKTWRHGDRAVPALARSLAVALAHDEGFDDLLALLEELPLAGRNLDDARKLWHARNTAGELKRRAAGWLRPQREASRDWTDLEDACLALVEALAAPPLGMTLDTAVLTFAQFTKAATFFGPDGLPQQRRAGEVAFSLATALDPFWSHDPRFVDLTEKAYLSAIRFAESAHAHNNLGSLYKDHQRRFDDAEREYLKAIELDPKLAAPHIGLGNLYQSHLRRFDDAEREYLKAIELDPEDPSPHLGLGNLYMIDLARFADAECEFRRWAEVDPKSSKARATLGELYGFYLARRDDAEGAFRQALDLDPTDDWAHAGLAWLDLVFSGDVVRAGASARDAVASDPKSLPGRLAGVAVTTWASGWPDALPAFRDWLAHVPSWFPGNNRCFLVPLFRKVREQGGLASLAEVLRDVSDRGEWAPWAEAVGALASGKGPEVCTDEEARGLAQAIASEPHRSGEV